jgi:cysteine desulfurase
MRPTYLDYNATAPVAPDIVDAMPPYSREHFGNASSGHHSGPAARDALEGGCVAVAEFLGGYSAEGRYAGGMVSVSYAAAFRTGSPLLADDPTVFRSVHFG